jgi:O-antigen ligase/tetratricopeptide (TPR) repeat protein
MPLAFGTVEQWSLTLMETSIFLALLLYLFRKIKGDSAEIYEVPGIIPLILLLLYILIQLIPLPSEIIKMISPSTYALHGETRGVYEPIRWLSISIDKKATVKEFFRILSYGSLYILTVQLLTKKDFLKKTVIIIVIFTSFLSFLSLLQHFLWNNKIFWFRELPQGARPFGPFVNRNHYAGFMEMIFPIILSLSLFYKPKVIEKSLQKRVYDFLNQEKTNIYILLAFSAILIATTVFLSLSRGGIVSLSLSMIFFGGILLTKEVHKKRGLVIILISLLIVFSVGWFGWEPIFKRFEALRNVRGDISELRLVIWDDSIKMIKDFPLTGTGFGSFVDIYPKYRTFPTEEIADHAHNDYLELLTDGGMIVFLLTGWFFLSVLYTSFRAFARRREPYSIYLFIGSTTGIVSILIHSLTDFNLHIGANGLYFFFLLGLVVSAANTRLRKGLDDTYLKKRELPFSKPFMFIPAIILLVSLIFNVGNLLGRFYFSFIKDVKLSRDISVKDLLIMKNVATKASFFDPLNANYHYALANIELLLSNKDIALSHYRKAIDLIPVNGEYLQRLGLLYSELGKNDKAERLIKAGITYDISNPSRYRIYALWLLTQGEKDEGLQYMKKAISLRPEKTRDSITAMILHGLTDEEIMISLPERVEPYLFFADYLDKTGNGELAEVAYLKALEFIKNEEAINPSYFYKIYRYFDQKGLHSDTLKVMQKGIEIFPDDPNMRLTAAGVYERAGMTHEAIEEYEKVLLINPNNERARKRLDEIRNK